MAKSRKPRKRKNGAADHVDWESLDAINPLRSEAIILRSSQAISGVLEELPELKIPIILQACDFSDRRLLLQQLLRELPADAIALNVRAIKVAASGRGNVPTHHKPRQVNQEVMANQ